jgi:cell division protein FtsB
MQKIEENTLYLVGHEKQMEALRAENERIRQRLFKLESELAALKEVKK